MTFNKRKFQFISTIDVDYPYMYLKKGLIRSKAGIIRDLLNRRFENIVLRLAVNLRIKPDPYMEAIRWIDSVHKESDKSYYLFILMEDRGKYGRKSFYPLTTFYKYLKNLKSVTVGLHPSYETYSKPELFVKERKRLEKALEREGIDTSRQHFLRMQVPETFRDLAAAGFKEDFTTAFAHAPGFRSGTAIPYFFYDVEKDMVCELLLRPTIMMDSCLITHLKLNPEEALELIKRLINECKQSGGDFVSLWHNSNLTDSKNNPWGKVFIEMFRYAISLEKDDFIPNCSIDTLNNC